MGASKGQKRKFTGNEAIYRPDVPVSRPLGGGDIGVGGGPGVPPRFPRGRRRRRGPDPRAVNIRRPLPKGALQGLATPPRGFEFNEDNELVPRKGPDPRAVNIRKPTRPKRGRRRMRSCPDPNMLILMSNDTQKKAGDLVVGDLVKTYHEESFDLGNYEVEYVNIVEDVEKIKLIFDQSEIICSLTHKFYVDNSWKEAKDMVIGDVVSDKKLTTIEKVEDGDVVHITVKDAHTYICEGLLSHNKRFAPGYKPPKDRPSAVQETTRVPVKDPTLGGPPEREVPIPKERLPRITRESDPRGGAPFSPDEKGMARDRFFERMFDRADEKRQQRDMEREEFRETRKAERDERRARRNDSGEIDIDAERGGRGRRRRRGGIRRNRRGRRRDFTRRRSEMEGGRRGRSREERAAFRDRYVSTLR